MNINIIKRIGLNPINGNKIVTYYKQSTKQTKESMDRFCKAHANLITRDQVTGQPSINLPHLHLKYELRDTESFN